MKLLFILTIFSISTPIFADEDFPRTNPDCLQEGEQGDVEPIESELGKISFCPNEKPQAELDSAEAECTKAERSSEPTSLKPGAIGLVAIFTFYPGKVKRIERIDFYEAKVKTIVGDSLIIYGYQRNRNQKFDDMSNFNWCFPYIYSTAKSLGQCYEKPKGILIKKNQFSQDLGEMNNLKVGEKVLLFSGQTNEAKIFRLYANGLALVKIDRQENPIIIVKQADLQAYPSLPYSQQADSYLNHSSKGRTEPRLHFREKSLIVYTKD